MAEDEPNEIPSWLERGERLLGSHLFALVVPVVVVVVALIVNDI